MADPNEADNPDPFAKFDVAATQPSYAPEPQVPPPPIPANQNVDPADPFANSDTQATSLNYTPTPPTSTAGAVTRELARDVIRGLGGLRAAAHAGQAGFAAGTAFPVLGPATPFVRALVGGGVAGYSGSEARTTVQNWAMRQLPDSVVKAAGQDEPKREQDEREPKTALLIAGTAPYLLAFKPGAWARAAGALPENATLYQKLSTSPVASHIFGGAVMGGLTAGQELAGTQPMDWQQVGLSTAFGFVFNEPTKVGNWIMGTAPHAPAARATTEGEKTKGPLPTLVGASDGGVFGPGITNATHDGAEVRAPDAEAEANESGSVEESIIGPPKGPSVNDVARQMHPDLFDQRDALIARQAEFRKWIDEFITPPPEAFQDLERQRADLQEKLDAHIESQRGNAAPAYTGGKEARRLRAQIRDVESQRQILTDRAAQFGAGQAEETPDLAMARKHLMDTEYELRDLGPQVRAAYGRAADAIGAGTVPPEPVQAAEAPPATPAPAAGPPAPPLIPEQAPPAAAAGPITKPIADQKAFIAQDVARQMVAAGRPAEEAAAYGQLSALKYATRAADMKIGR